MSDDRSPTPVCCSPPCLNTDGCIVTGCRAQPNKFYIKPDNVKTALLYAQSALRRWTELYAKLQNECGNAISRKLDYNLPPADHLRALEAIAEALSTCSESTRSDGPKPCQTLMRDEIIERVESYFGRVRKLGGDTGECSAASLADFLLYQRDKDNCAAAISVPSAGWLRKTDPLFDAYSALRSTLGLIVSSPGKFEPDFELEIRQAVEAAHLALTTATSPPSATTPTRDAIIEQCARACEKLAERRFDEYGLREHDTNATYYTGSAAGEYDTRDEEDADCAAAVRALKAVPNV